MFVKIAAIVPMCVWFMLGTFVGFFGVDYTWIMLTVMPAVAGLAYLGDLERDREWVRLRDADFLKDRRDRD
jgi:hypothetical protein